MNSDFLKFNLQKGENIYEIKLKSLASLYSSNPDKYFYECVVKDSWNQTSQNYKIFLTKEFVYSKKLNRFDANLICARLVFDLLEIDKYEAHITDTTISSHLDKSVISKDELRHKIMHYLKAKFDDSPETATIVFELLAALRYSPRELIRAIKTLSVRKLFSLSSNLQDYDRIKELDKPVDIYDQLSTAISISYGQIEQIEQKISEFERKFGVKESKIEIGVTTEKRDQDGIKVFLSYSTKNKKNASDLKDGLEFYGLDVFMAHQKIRVSQQWEDRILQELHDCQVFVALITKDFVESNWTDQEAGFAMAYDKKIIPVITSKRIPHGFLNRYQGERLKLDKRKTSKQIVLSLAEDDKLNQSFRNGLIKKYGSSVRFDTIRGTIDNINDFSKYSAKELG